MSRLCAFTELRGKREVHVNPTTVRVVIRNPKDGTDIVFGEGHAVTVAEPIQVVVEKLDAG